MEGGGGLSASGAKHKQHGLLASRLYWAGQVQPCWLYAAQRSTGLSACQSAHPRAAVPRCALPSSVVAAGAALHWCRWARRCSRTAAPQRWGGCSCIAVCYCHDAGVALPAQVHFLPSEGSAKNACVRSARMPCSSDAPNCLECISSCTSHSRSHHTIARRPCSSMTPRRGRCSWLWTGRTSRESRCWPGAGRRCAAEVLGKSCECRV